MEAYKWWLLAAGQGDEDARNSVKLLEDRMTPEQIAEGQKLVRQKLAPDLARLREENKSLDDSFERPIPAQIPPAAPADDRRTFTRHSSQAAEGRVYPQFLLGLDYWYGRGTATNRELALHWIQKAATAGSPEAKGFLRTNSPAPIPDERAR